MCTVQQSVGWVAVRRQMSEDWDMFNILQQREMLCQYMRTVVPK